MEHMKPPKGMTFQGNVSDNWTRFRQRLELYMEALNMDTKPDKRKIAILLTVAGQEAVDIFNTLTFADGERDNYNTVLRKFDNYCTPRVNETYERYVFRTRLQRDEETIEQYVTDLKYKAKSCNYGDLEESLIRDQIVLGTPNVKVKERLLSIDDLNLEKTVSICQASEVAKRQIRAMTDGPNSGTTTASVGAIKRSGHSSTSNHGNQTTHSGKRSEYRSTRGNGPRRQRTCGRCGRKHAYNECPAWGTVCEKCRMKNHFSSRCKTKSISTVDNRTQNYDSHSESEEEIFVHSVDTVTGDEWFAPLAVNGTILPLKIDTGAQANLLSMKDYKSLTDRPKLRVRATNLTCYNNSTIPTAGTCRVRVKCNNRTYNVAFTVVTGDHTVSLLGSRASKQMGLVKISPVVQIHTVNKGSQIPNHVYEGLGCLPGKHHIQLKENAVPTVHAARRVPFALREKLKSELDRLEKMGVIKRTEEPTDWVNALVIVEKPNGSLRLCLDPKNLNAYIKREHHHLPHKSEIVADMAGAQFFSKLDASQGFYQMQLDDASTKLCTMATPFGRYSFQRMPYGISSAPEVYHKTIERLMEGLEGVRVFIDDILIWGTTKEEHDSRLQCVLQRINATNLKLNKSKCETCVEEITFLGDRLTRNGVQPDDRKVKAIHEMQRPETKEDVKRALGLINYLSRFIPHQSANNKALRSLLKEDTAWEWSTQHEHEWNEIKTVLTNKPVLVYFDPQKQIKISSDASKDGLGAVIMQLHDSKWLPVAYAARSMTDAECRYAQIEKECLGIVFACEKFHEYIYGAKIAAETDHKPLVGIITKSLSDMTPRIQRLMLRIRRYDMDLQYTPGKSLILADALSRGRPPKKKSDTEEEISIHVNLVKKSMPVSDVMWKTIAEETDNDDTLRRVKSRINNDNDSTESCSPYHNFLQELSVVDGVIIKSNRVVVPTSLRQRMLQIIHEGHMGIEKCRSRARRSLYWPNMNDDIHRVVSNCDTCQQYQYKQQKEPLKQHKVPTTPWTKIGTDLFTLNGADYLVVVDYTSNFLEIVKLRGTTSKHVIDSLKSIMSRYGIPKIVFSDNGPQFSSAEFKSFAKEYNFNPETSSPYYAQSNGRSEKAVQIAKRLLKKSALNNEDPHLALLAYRTAPLESGKSPAELFFGRQLRTRLPNVHHYGNKKLQEGKQRQKKYYDKSAKPLKPLHNNDNVRLYANGSWKQKARVVEEVSPHSYNVQTEEGDTYRRNRRHLHHTADTPVTDHKESTPEALSHVEQSDQPVAIDLRSTGTTVTTRSGRIVKQPERYVEIC